MTEHLYQPLTEPTTTTAAATAFSTATATASACTCSCWHLQRRKGRLQSIPSCSYSCIMPYEAVLNSAPESAPGVRGSRATSSKTPNTAWLQHA
eukprot:15670-Heterococcus_DN1.PRE.1